MVMDSLDGDGHPADGRGVYAERLASLRRGESGVWPVVLAASEVLGMASGWDGDAALSSLVHRIIAHGETTGEPGDAGVLHALSHVILGDDGWTIIEEHRAELHARLPDGMLRTREASPSSVVLLIIELGRRLDLALLPLWVRQRPVICLLNAMGDVILALDPQEEATLIAGEALDRLLAGHVTLLADRQRGVLPSIMRREALGWWLHGLRDLFLHGPALEPLVHTMEFEQALQALPGSLVDEVQRFVAGRAAEGGMDPDVAARYMHRLEALEEAPLMGEAEEAADAAVAADEPEIDAP